jgi:hypothetical protein
MTTRLSAAEAEGSRAAGDLQIIIAARFVSAAGGPAPGPQACAAHGIRRCRRAARSRAISANTAKNQAACTSSRNAPDRIRTCDHSLVAT